MRTIARSTACRAFGAGLVVLLGLAACDRGENHEVKGLKMQVEDAYGAKDFAKVLELSQKGFALASKAEGDTAPDTLYFAQGISVGQIHQHNTRAAIAALKQEIALRRAAGQSEKKVQSRRTLLIQLAENVNDSATAIDQTVTIAKDIGMGPGKDPQPTYETPTDYPPDLYRQHVEGYVDLSYDLDADGRPTSVRVAKSDPPGAFDDAALESFRKWRFTPFLDNDTPVASTGHHYTLEFRIPRGQ